MTLVLYWLQESHGFRRLSAVAVSRTSRELGDDKRETVTEHAPKLRSAKMGRLALSWSMQDRPGACAQSASLDPGDSAPARPPPGTAMSATDDQWDSRAEPDMT
jgi:hypothetical protein